MKFLSCILLMVLLLSACEKGEEYNPGSGDPDVSMVFYSLSTDKDSVTAGETAKITALATGENLTYSWRVTAGSILGSGHEVYYGACSCHNGKNTITCTITDRNNKSESREVSIFVH